LKTLRPPGGDFESFHLRQKSNPYLEKLNQSHALAIAHLSSNWCQIVVVVKQNADTCAQQIQASQHQEGANTDQQTAVGLIQLS